MTTLILFSNMGCVCAFVVLTLVYRLLQMCGNVGILHVKCSDVTK